MVQMYNAKQMTSCLRQTPRHINIKGNSSIQIAIDINLGLPDEIRRRQGFWIFYTCLKKEMQEQTP